MNLFYAMGGGWGHLKRVSTFIQNEQIEQFKIITSNPLAERFFHGDSLCLLSNDLANSQNALVDALESIIERENPDRMLIDVFPNGILGELSLVPSLRYLQIEILCRRVKWDSYSNKLSTKLLYSRAYVFEDLEEAHGNFLSNHADRCIRYDLQYEIPSIDNPFQSENQEIWLIIHGFNPEEVDSLCRYAMNKARAQEEMPMLILASDCNPDIEGILKTGEKQPVALAPFVDKIFTACGFNIMQETVNFREKQHFMPFPRKYDDQFWRLEKMGLLPA